MNYKNLKNIVPSAAFAAGILFVNGCSDPSENAKTEEFPEVVATVPLKRDVALVDEYTARLAAVVIEGRRFEEVSKSCQRLPKAAKYWGSRRLLPRGKV